jgi:hypothetical protein
MKNFRSLLEITFKGTDYEMEGQADWNYKHS